MLFLAEPTPHGEECATVEHVHIYPNNYINRRVSSVPKGGGTPCSLAARHDLPGVDCAFAMGVGSLRLITVFSAIVKNILSKIKHNVSR